MTNWGYLLLAVYVGLGLSDVPRAKAVALAAVVTSQSLATGQASAPAHHAPRARASMSSARMVA